MNTQPNKGDQQVAPTPRQPDLFAAPLLRCIDTLKGINPDDLTPKAALELLYRLKGEL